MANDAQVKFKVLMEDEASSALDTLNKKAIKLDDSVKQASNKFTDFGNKAQDVAFKFVKAGGLITAGLTVPLMAIGTKAFEMAAEFNDAIGATDQIFKGSSNAMQFWAKNLETYYGVAEKEALVYANTMGAMLQNIGGLSEKKAAQQSQILVELAGDLSAMFGGTTESAVQALTGALKGNNTMLDNYGMAVTEGMIKTRALEMGLIKEGEEMTLVAKQAATLALIMEQAGDATGQAERESKGASGTVKTLQTEMANLTKTLGEELLPIVVPVIEKFVEIVKTFSQFDDKTKATILTVGLFLVAVGPVVTIMGALISVLGVASTIIGAFALAMSGGTLAANASTIAVIAYNVAQGIMAGMSMAAAAATWLLNGALAVLTSPITLVIVGIALLVAAIVWLINNFELVKDTAFVVFKAIGNFFISMANTVIGGINSLIEGFLEPFNAIIEGLNELPGINIKPLSFSFSKIPMLNVGTNFVAQDGLAYLHRGEAVVPKKYNPAAGGNTSNSNTVIQNFYSQVVSPTDAYRKKVELAYAY